MKKWENFSDEQIRDFVKESKTMKELAKKLGYASNSGNTSKVLKEMLEEKNIDFSHFLGKGWNKGNINFSKFKQNTKASKIALKNLIAIRGHQCERCHQASWLSQPIPLEVHHIDGDRFNNELNNLQLLCPNCHALTENFCNKNNSIDQKKVSDKDLIEALKTSKSINDALNKLKMNTSGENYKRAYSLIEENHITFPISNKKNNVCCDCGQPISSSAIRCIKCEHKKQQIVERPNREELKKLIRTQTFISIGSQYGVSDNAVRKWCQSENLPFKSSEIKKISDEEWQKI